MPKLTATLVNRLLENPEESVHHIKLVYVDDNTLTIVRKKMGADFIYIQKNKKLSHKNHLERIQKLVIPPAWNNVRITHLENGHLQAVGRDSKNRKQYKYHPLWSKVRNQTKFFRQHKFGENLSKIREKVNTALDLPEWNQEKIVALVIRIMDESNIRIGNISYAKNNKTYGLVTMRKKHLVHNQNKIRFEFVGKRGKEHKVTIRNKKLTRLIRQCEEIPGWELFQFYDENGQKQRVTSTMVNSFLSDLTGEHFTAKDFRTWSATVVFYETLVELKNHESFKLEKKIIMAYDAAASALGNTRNVCKKYYVHPEIVHQFKRDFTKISSSNSKSDYEFLSAAENQVMHLIKDYRPNI